jgi:hypothetical protein
MADNIIKLKTDLIKMQTSWDDITDKPNLVTVEYLEQRLNEILTQIQQG